MRFLNYLNENSKFLFTKGQVGKLTNVSKLVQYIEQNSQERIDLQSLRRKLKGSSEFYGLTEVNVKDLEVQDYNDLEIPNYVSNNPIVIDKDG